MPSWWSRTSSARSKQGLNPRAAAHAAMGEVTRPIISIALVLCAVFVPVAFVSGLTGQFYRQFAHHHRGEHPHLDVQFADACRRHWRRCC